MGSESDSGDSDVRTLAFMSMFWVDSVESSTGCNPVFLSRRKLYPIRVRNPDAELVAVAVLGRVGLEMQLNTARPLMSREGLATSLR